MSSIYAFSLSFLLPSLRFMSAGKAFRFDRITFQPSADNGRGHALFLIRKTETDPVRIKDADILVEKPQRHAVIDDIRAGPASVLGEKYRACPVTHRPEAVFLPALGAALLCFLDALG